MNLLRFSGLRGRKKNGRETDATRVFFEIDAVDDSVAVQVVDGEQPGQLLLLERGQHEWLLLGAASGAAGAMHNS